MQQLNESTGLAGRRPGDQFVDSSGDTLTFNDLEFYPQAGGQLDAEQLDATIKAVEAKAGKKIQWENAKSARTGGFSVASFTHGNDTILVGTYLQQVKANFSDNYIPNLILKKYKFQGKAAVKTQAGLTPQDLLTKRTELTVKDIMVQLAQKLGTSNPLYHLAHHVATGGQLPYEFSAPQGVSFTAFRDYFCEILQPVALHTGTYSGNAGEAAATFLAPQGFSGTLINFDQSKNAGLSDSTLELRDGRSISVSSKGDKGAEASAKNLLDKVDELNKTEAGKKVAKKYAGVIEILRDVQAAGQAGAPLYLGVKYGIINKREAEIIRGLKNAAPVDISDSSKLQALAGIGLTPNLIELAAGRGTKEPTRAALYYHLMAAVAHKAAELVNTKTDFSKAASTILNNGALVQVYTKASQRGDKWVLNDFETLYPSTAVTGVVLSAQKNYSSTSIKGNYTFKILRGGGTATKEDVDTPHQPQQSMQRGRKVVPTVQNPPQPRDGAGRLRRK